MKTVLHKSAFLIACLSLGLGLGWLIWGRSNPATDQVARLIEQKCLPFLDSDPDQRNAHVFPEMIPRSFDGVSFDLEKKGAKDFGCTIFDEDIVWTTRTQEALFASASDWAQQWIKPRNNGDMVFLDLSETDGVTRYHMYRPAGLQGYFLMIFTASKADTTHTFLMAGWSDRFEKPVKDVLTDV